MTKTKESPIEFSRRAARVIHAPYFYTSIESKNVREHIRLTNRRNAEYTELQRAFLFADTYDDLPPDAMSIFDKAEKSIKEFEDDEVFADRMSDVGNLYVAPEALANREPDPETSAILALATL